LGNMDNLLTNVIEYLKHKFNGTNHGIHYEGALHQEQACMSSRDP
jgi:hypothetical protein